MPGKFGDRNSDMLSLRLKPFTDSRLATDMNRRLFAVIPAAGHSRRMGQPKLLLPLGGETVIARILGTLKIPEITETIVVIRKDDERLRDAVIRAGASAVQPAVDPPDMRTSVTHALQAIAERWKPDPLDAWMLSPADHPALDRSLIQALARRWQETTEPILVPLHAGRRGHPTLFAWNLNEQINQIPEGEGLNRLLKSQTIAELQVDCAGIFEDLDTPEDYARLLSRWEHNDPKVGP